MNPEPNLAIPILTQHNPSADENTMMEDCDWDECDDDDNYEKACLAKDWEDCDWEDYDWDHCDDDKACSAKDWEEAQLSVGKQDLLRRGTPCLYS